MSGLTVSKTKSALVFVGALDKFIEAAYESRYHKFLRGAVPRATKIFTRMFRVQWAALTLALERASRPYREASGDSPQEDWLDRINWDAVIDLAAIAGTAVAIEALRIEIEMALAFGARVALERLGSPLGLVFDLANPRAVEYIQTRGAELISKVSQTTKDRCRVIIANGMKGGQSYDKIAKALTNEFAEFAVGKPQLHIQSRAHLIAVTEMAEAYGHGNYIQGLEIEALGIRLEKSWVTVGDDRVSDGCADNESAGWIPFQAEFPSGHLHEPRFPGCRCTVVSRRIRTIE